MNQLNSKEIKELHQDDFMLSFLEFSSDMAVLPYPPCMPDILVQLLDVMGAGEMNFCSHMERFHCIAKGWALDFIMDFDVKNCKEQNNGKKRFTINTILDSFLCNYRYKSVCHYQDWTLLHATASTIKFGTDELCEIISELCCMNCGHVHSQEEVRRFIRIVWPALEGLTISHGWRTKKSPLKRISEITVRILLTTIFRCLNHRPEHKHNITRQSTPPTEEVDHPPEQRQTNLTLPAAYNGCEVPDGSCFLIQVSRIVKDSFQRIGVVLPLTYLSSFSGPVWNVENSMERLILKMIYGTKRVKDEVLPYWMYRKYEDMRFYMFSHEVRGAANDDGDGGLQYLLEKTEWDEPISKYCPKVNSACPIGLMIKMCLRKSLHFHDEVDERFDKILKSFLLWLIENPAHRMMDLWATPWD